MQMHKEPNDETRLTSARILPSSLLCGRASRLSLFVHLRIAECLPVRWQASSFARLALCPGLCALQMCLLCVGYIAFAFVKMLSNRSMPSINFGRSLSSHVRNVSISLYCFSRSLRLRKIGS